MSKDFNHKTVFLITIDALSARHLKSYGYHRNCAPNLEKFVKNGVMFLNAIANGPATPSSFSAIFTSILPFLNGGYSPLPKQKITFPQLLAENGIYNYAIHNNPNLGKFFNYDRGFNKFLDGTIYTENQEYNKKKNIKQIFSSKIKNILSKEFTRKILFLIPGFNKLKNWIRNKIPVLTKFLLPFTPIGYNAPFIVNKILDFLNKFQGSLFLWAHFMDVHRPYNPPSKNILKFKEKDFTRFEKKFLIDEIRLLSNRNKITPDWIKKLEILYDAEINFVDEYILKLYNFIDQKFKNNCLIIITSDHGESFYEHEILGHQGSVFEELIKVPLFIVEKGRNIKENKISQTVQLIDIAPTILDFFNIGIPEDFQGLSLLPLLKGESLKRNAPVITECYQKGGFMKRNNEEGFKLIAIRKDGWKYIYDEEKEKEYLFNLSNDPEEKVNLIQENNAKLEEFKLIRDYHLLKVTTSTEKAKIIDIIGRIKIK